MSDSENRAKTFFDLITEVSSDSKCTEPENVYFYLMVGLIGELLGCDWKPEEILFEAMLISPGMDKNEWYDAPLVALKDMIQACSENPTAAFAHARVRLDTLEAELKTETEALAEARAFKAGNV